MGRPVRDRSSSEIWQLPGGLLAQRATIISNELIAEELLTVINGRIILLSSLGDREVFDQIAITLKESR